MQDELAVLLLVLFLKTVSSVQELKEWSGAIQTTISALQMGTFSQGSGYT